jgi:hypothetical protein
MTSVNVLFRVGVTPGVVALDAEGALVDSMRNAEVGGGIRGGVKGRCAAPQSRTGMGVSSRGGATGGLLTTRVAGTWYTGAEAADWNIAGFTRS